MAISRSSGKRLAAWAVVSGLSIAHGVSASAQVLQEYRRQRAPLADTDPNDRTRIVLDDLLGPDPIPFPALDESAPAALLQLAQGTASKQAIKDLDLTLVDSRGAGPLHYAACAPGADNLEAIILRHRRAAAAKEVPTFTRLMPTDKFGFTPMHYAVQHGRASSITALRNAFVRSWLANREIWWPCEMPASAYSPLHLAVLRGDRDCVVAILDEIVLHQVERQSEFDRWKTLKFDVYAPTDPVNGLDYRGNCALQYAVAIGDAQMVDTLLARGADPALVGCIENRGVWFGDLNANIAAVRRDLAGQRDVRPPVDQFALPVIGELDATHQAEWILFQQRMEETLRALPGEPIRGNGMNSWVLALIMDRPMVLEALIRHSNPDPAVRSACFADSLAFASNLGSLRCLEWLLDSGQVSVRQRTKDGRTPMHWVGTVDVVRALHRRDPLLLDALDAQGNTPALDAARLDRAAVLEELHRLGARLDVPNSAGETPIEIAASRNACAALEILLRETPPADHGTRALRYAVLNGCAETVALLLAHGADPVRSASKDEPSALYAAVQSGDERIVRLLLQHAPGAALTEAHRYGYTMLHVAAESGHPGICTALLDAGADCSARTGSGSTPLAIALQQQHWPVVDLLQSRSCK